MNILRLLVDNRPDLGKRLHAGTGSLERPLRFGLLELRLAGEVGRLMFQAPDFKAGNPIAAASPEVEGLHAAHRAEDGRDADSAPTAGDGDLLPWNGSQSRAENARGTGRSRNAVGLRLKAEHLGELPRVLRAFSRIF